MSSCMLSDSGTSSPELTVMIMLTSCGIALNLVILMSDTWSVTFFSLCLLTIWIHFYSIWWAGSWKTLFLISRNQKQRTEFLLFFLYLSQVKSTISRHVMTQCPALWASLTTMALWCTTVRRPSTSALSPPSSPRSLTSWMWLVRGWASVLMT